MHAVAGEYAGKAQVRRAALVCVLLGVPCMSSAEHAMTLTGYAALWSDSGDDQQLFGPTTSSVVTPMSLFLSYTFNDFNTSAAMGTVELTGLEMMFNRACTRQCIVVVPSRFCT